MVTCIEMPYIILKPAEGWQANLLNCLNQAFESTESKEYAHELKVKNSLLGAWIELLQNLSAVRVRRGAAIIGAERIKDMVSYIDRHYRDKITLADIARGAGISQSEACSMLQSGTKLSMVADGLGFTDYSYFHRVFKKYMKCTPKEYLENIQAAKA